MRVRYFGHSSLQIKTDKYEILIDPFLDNNPVSPIKSDDVKADFIILTHAHGDHLGDSLKIGKKHNPLFICVNELAEWLKSKGMNAHNMHIGGSRKFDFGRVKFTIAHHGSITPDGQYAGEPAGVILSINGKTIYHTGDTGLFMDMKLIGETNSIDYMFVPIGDNFTMGIDDAVKAVEFVQPKVVIPIHYNTFPVIEANPLEFKDKVETKGYKCIVMNFGDEIEL
jgi:L-ascorbate metabolism protein UlaG (beta-lactamase superfamily)